MISTNQVQSKPFHGYRPDDEHVPEQPLEMVKLWGFIAQKDVLRDPQLIADFGPQPDNDDDDDVIAPVAKSNGGNSDHQSVLAPSIAENAAVPAQNVATVQSASEAKPADDVVAKPTGAPEQDARHAGHPAPKPAIVPASAATLADFLRRVLVLPDPGDTGWINIHWRGKGKKGITGGQACKTLEEAVSTIRWTQSKGKAHIDDVYFCTSLQKEHGDPKPNGRYSALRSIDNTISSKLLFADVDKYADKTEALAAIKSFCERSNSPYPTVIVDSGGGLHVYWILPKPLPKKEWLELAAKLDGLLNQYGLKHDNITADMSRILRPPETFNYKKDVPRPVVLKMLNGDVDLNSWASLHNATPTKIASPVTKPSSTPIPDEKLFVDPSTAGDGPAALFATEVPLEERLNAGHLDPAPACELCPMFRETLATGGEKVEQPVWHQQALASTFMIGGRKLFHDLSRKHPKYAPADTDTMFDRKLRDRTTKGLGYPSCAAFEADGAAQCKTCPYHGKVTSPLNLEADAARTCGRSDQRSGNRRRGRPQRESHGSSAHFSNRAATEPPPLSGRLLRLRRWPLRRSRRPHD
jgi:hypothetical protein